MARKKKTTEQWIKEATEVHGEEYDYSSSVYLRSDEAITIICKIHGPFSQIASRHLRPQKCPECNSELQRKGLECFIKDAQSVHGKKYSYSKVEYIGNKKKVIITCPFHGDFSITPIKHSRG